MNDLIGNIQKKINSGDKRALASVTGRAGKSLSNTLDKKLESTANDMKNILQKWIEYYFRLYTPSIYRRTGAFVNSLEVEVSPSDNGLPQARVFFGKGAVRDSLWHGSSQQGYLPALLNDGWRVKGGWHRNIPHFGHFQGVGFMESAVAEAKNNPRFAGIEIVLNLNSPY